MVCIKSRAGEISQRLALGEKCAQMPISRPVTTQNGTQMTINARLSMALFQTPKTASARNPRPQSSASLMPP